jgi:hypothetical protein
MGLPPLPPSQGYQVTLEMFPWTSTAPINLYAAYDVNGGIGYLTDTNAAAAQFTQLYLNNQLMFDYAKKLATIDDGKPYNLPLNTDGTLQFSRFLFEGAGAGLSQLELKVWQVTPQGTTNLLAWTSAWIELQDVKNLYERAASTNGPTSLPPYTNDTGFRMIYSPPSTLSEDKQVIVFVHGINNSQFNFENTTETIFKRLFWPCLGLVDRWCVNV